LHGTPSTSEAGARRRIYKQNITRIATRRAFASGQKRAQQISDRVGLRSGTLPLRVMRLAIGGTLAAGGWTVRVFGLYLLGALAFLATAACSRERSLQFDGGTGVVTTDPATDAAPPPFRSGPAAEAAVSSIAACRVWSRPSGGAVPPPGGAAGSWSRRFGGPNGDLGFIARAVDGQGGVVFASIHNDPVDFGSGPVSAPGCQFLSSYAADGSHRWTRTLDRHIFALALGRDGSIAAVQQESSGLPGGSIITVLEPDGSVRWVRDLGAELVQTIAIADDGSIVMISQWVPYQAGYLDKLDPGGEFVGTDTFNLEGTGQKATFALSPAGEATLVLSSDGSGGGFGGDLVIARYDANVHRTGFMRFQSVAGVTTLDVAVAPDGGAVWLGYTGGDLDLGAGPIAQGSTRVGALARFDARGALVVSRTFDVQLPYESRPYGQIAVLPSNALMVGGDFAGTLAVDDSTAIHTGAKSDVDFQVTSFDASLKPTSVQHFGNGGGTQSLSAFTVAPDGGLLLSGTFESKLDVGSGLMREAGGTDAFIARVAPGPIAWSPSSGSGPSLPPGYTAPAPPQIACDAASGGPAACDIPPSACAAVPSVCPNQSCDAIWFAYYENPRCVDGWCVWDQSYFGCTRAFYYCREGACIYESPTA
jgi:hypothetical protein